MLKTLSVASLFAVTQAIKLQATKFRALDDLSSWSKTTEAGNEVRAAGVKWEDPVFPPNDESRGVVEGDSANVANGSQSNAVSWKRLSEIYPADALTLFAGKEIFSSAEQGALGDCYFIASMIMFDSRPGALEDLFVTDAVNAAGAYTIKFYV
jgi:hypothetical protein